MKCGKLRSFPLDVRNKLDKICKEKSNRYVVHFVKHVITHFGHPHKQVVNDSFHFIFSLTNGFPVGRGKCFVHFKAN